MGERESVARLRDSRSMADWVGGSGPERPAALSRRRFLGLLAAGAATLAGCGPGARSAPSVDDLPALAATPTPARAATPGWASALLPPAGPLDRPLRVGLSKSIEFAAVWVARARGFFKASGIDVEVVLVDDPLARLNDLGGGALDAVGASLDMCVRMAGKGVPLVQVLAFDQSAGGDGIVARKHIASIPELKGKQVAVRRGSTEHWFLAMVLAQHGMTVDDVEVKELGPDDAGSAFVKGNIDAAVTSGAWLARAVQTKFGGILATSADYPGILADVLAVHPDVVRNHRDAVLAFLQGWRRGADYLRASQADALTALAALFKVDQDAVKRSMGGLAIFDLAEARAYLGVPGAPGPIYAVEAKAVDFWRGLDVIQLTPDIPAIIDPSLLAAL